MAEAEDVLGSALGQDVKVRRAGNGVKAELNFDDLSSWNRSPAACASVARIGGRGRLAQLVRARL